MSFRHQAIQMEERDASTTTRPARPPKLPLLPLPQ